jgi:hypothetical protein
MTGKRSQAMVLSLQHSVSEPVCDQEGFLWQQRLLLLASVPWFWGQRFGGIKTIHFGGFRYNGRLSPA